MREVRNVSFEKRRNVKKKLSQKVSALFSYELKKSGHHESLFAFSIEAATLNGQESRTHESKWVAFSTVFIHNILISLCNNYTHGGGVGTGGLVGSRKNASYIFILH